MSGKKGEVFLIVGSYNLLEATICRKLQSVGNLVVGVVANVWHFEEARDGEGRHPRPCR